MYKELPFRDAGRRPPKLHIDGSVAYADLEIAGKRVTIRSSMLAAERPVFRISDGRIAASNGLADNVLRGYGVASD